MESFVYYIRANTVLIAPLLFFPSLFNEAISISSYVCQRQDELWIITQQRVG